MLTLGQGLENVFYKGLDSKYFRLYRVIVSALTTQFYYCAVKTAIDNTCSCVPIRLYYGHWIWIAYNFHITECYSFDFFQQLKNVKPFLTCRPNKNKLWARFGRQAIFCQTQLYTVWKPLPYYIYNAKVYT